MQGGVRCKARSDLRLGCLNVRGCGAVVRRCEIGKLFESCNLDVLAINETKMKGCEEVMFGCVKGVVSGVKPRLNAQQGVGFLVSERVWSCVQEWKGVSSRIMWLRLKFGCEKWLIISVYGPDMGRREAEREAFWEDLNECVKECRADEKVVVLGDMNAKVGEHEIDGITGKYGVPGVNENGERLVELCAERGLIVGNTWFKKRENQKYTWIGDGDRNGQKGMIDLVLIGRAYVKRLLDVSVKRGLRVDRGDHALVRADVRIKEEWYKKPEGVNVKEVINVNKLQKDECKVAYKRKVMEEWVKVKGTEVGQVEDEWKRLRESMLQGAKSVCGCRRIGNGKRKKGSEWWNDEASKLVREKRELYSRYLQSMSAEVWQEYRMKCLEVKRRLNELKKEADERWGARVSECFKESKKLFWKEVNGVRKKRESCATKMKDANGNLLSGEKEVSARWKEYFCELLNVRDERKAELTMLGREGMDLKRVSVSESISVREVKDALKKVKRGKAAGLDGVAAEMMKEGGECMLEWIVRLFNVCLNSGEVPEDWKRACVVPLYKGKGEKCVCGSYRGISLLSVTGKLYGRVLIQRVRKETERLVKDVQGGFRQGRGCVDQIFALKCACEEYLGKNKSVFVAFMDLEKAYDRVDRDALWTIVKMYGVNEKLVKAMQSFYSGSKACVRVGRKESEWFDVKVGLRQGCVMSPWLFNLYADGVVREVNARVCERGVKMKSEDGSKYEWNQLLFADDTVLASDSMEGLQHLVNTFSLVCERRKLKVNVGKSKVMWCNRDGNKGLNVSLNGECLEEVDRFKYLGVTISADGRMEGEISQRVSEGMKVFGAVRKVWEGKRMSVKAKMGMYKSIVVPTVLYGCEAWNLNKSERKRVDVMEMKCLRSVCGVKRIDRVRNDDVRARCGNEVSLLERADRGVLRWFGHVERMDDERIVKKIYKSEVDGVRAVGRPRMRWMDGVKDILQRRNLTIQDASRLVRDRSEWRAFVHGKGRRTV